LLAALNEEFRELSAATILFHQAVADRLGLNVTDHKCADILSRTGPITAGELARRTGLTTGAITGIIDRLESAGFVRRVRDPRDRRRVILEPMRKQLEQQIAPLFASMAQAVAELTARYSLQELTVIRDWAARSLQMAREETRKLREPGAPSRRSKGARATKR
jgi:DNA-binding MarR family transcriptional regulator